MNLEIATSSSNDHQLDTTVVFVSRGRSVHKGNGKSRPKILSSHSDKKIQNQIQQAVDRKVITGQFLETVFFRLNTFTAEKNLLIVGLGPRRKQNMEMYRKASAAAVNALNANKIKSATFALEMLSSEQVSAAELTRAFCEGAVLANYRFAYPTEKSSSAAVLEKIDFFISDLKSDHEKGIKLALILAESTLLARDWGNQPGNLLTPALFSESVKKVAKGNRSYSNVKVEIWDHARIKKESMHLFLGVAKGSSEEPKFIIVEYFGAAENQKPICFVGKGVTFDSGGTSLKPHANMEDMKFDMCGGSSVIASVLAIAKLKLKLNVIAIVPATENMPGPSALKPGDVIVARNGKTVEIINTDAEGRLILADALSYACDRKPEFIIDVATLTGAVSVALGNTHTALFTRNRKLKALCMQASFQSGERMWQLPLNDYHVRDMKGTYSDLKNLSTSKAACSTAAAFLEQFVDRETPWAHLDIGGTAWNVGERLAYCQHRGSSGVMVRTLVQIAMDFEKSTL